jgi:hypothetical protein
MEEKLMIGKEAYEEAIREKGQAWTFLFYDDADVYSGISRLDDFAEHVWSGENVNYLVLQDVSYGPAKLWYIDEKGDKVLLEEMGEVNMASPETLYDFLNYAKIHFPAERYIMSIYDGGLAWFGACWDLSADYDNLSMDDMQKALSKAGGVDLVLFTGTPFMGCLESTYELRNCADVYIGSEGWSTYGCWKESMQLVCEMLHSQPNISNHYLAGKIIEFIWNNNSGIYSSDFTMSAIRMDKIVPLKEAIQAVASEYYSDTDKFGSHMNFIVGNCTIFSDRFADVYDVAEKLLLVEEDEETRTKLENVKLRLRDAVITQCHGSEWPNAHGLTIYLPNLFEVDFHWGYPLEEIGLDFTLETYWDDLLYDYALKMLNYANKTL